MKFLKYLDEKFSNEYSVHNIIYVYIIQLFNIYILNYSIIEIKLKILLC